MLQKLCLFVFGKTRLSLSKSDVLSNWKHLGCITQNCTLDLQTLYDDNYYYYWQEINLSEALL